MLGATGVLGSSIVKHLNISNDKIISHNTYLNWIHTPNKDQILRDLKKHDLSKVDIFVAAGITDPRIDSNLLWGLNYKLPRNLIGATANSGTRVITFGTIHESFTINNEYFASKRALGDYIGNIGSFGAVRHFLLHTLYSDNPPPEHMFLGHIFKAIKTGSDLNMSPGKQLREFHHVDDIAQAVIKLLLERESKMQDVSAGNGIQIRVIAREIFSIFGVLNNLHLGVLPSPAGDNFERVFSTSKGLVASDFRNPVSEIPRIFKKLISPN